MRNGGRLTNDVESNVQVWKYTVELEAVERERGERFYEGTLAMSQLKCVEGFRLVSRKSILDLSLESGVQAE